MNIIYRKAELTDLPEIVDMQREAYKELKSYFPLSHIQAERIFSEQIKNPLAVNILAVKDGAVIGCLQFLTMNDILTVTHWYVSEKYRAGRVGVKLLSFVYDHAEAEKVSAVILNVHGNSSERIEKYLRSRGWGLLSKQFIKKRSS